MCGIYAYQGTKKNATQTVFQGLKDLEYRGYDSWGIVVEDKKRTLSTHKTTGKIGTANIDALPQSHFALGHTRWATHGGVTMKNAHPHLDCTGTVALVHNGIIDNHQSLKIKLKKKGHTFSSETDTEVAVHLIEENLKSTTFPEAVRQSFVRLEGLSALVALHQPSHTLVAVKKGSPLVVGIGKKEVHVASDPVAIRPHTDQVVYLKDGHMVVIQDNHLTYCETQSGKAVRYAPETISWSPQAAKKGEAPHYMIKEIREQPEILSSFPQTSKTQTSHLASKIEASKKVLLSGCGTAGHAAFVGKYLLHRSGIDADAIEGSELEWFMPQDESVYPIFLSQSGETIDIVQPAKELKKRGIPFGSIVNRLGSTLERMSKDKVLLSAGPEICVVSTKVFTAKVAALLLIAGHLKGEYEQVEETIIKAAGEIKRVTTEQFISEHIDPVVALLKDAPHVFTLGRGISYPVAKEAALKIKEVAYIHTEGFAGGELKHGVIALIEEGTPVIVFAPKDETYKDIISNATEVKARGGTIIGISESSNPVFDYHIPVNDLSAATAIPHTVIAQLVGYRLAVELGLDPDKPRNLAKSVTVK